MSDPTPIPEPREPVPSDRKVKIFQAMPPANKDTFLNSAIINLADPNPIAAVLYAPDLEQLVCLDNTESPSDSSWSESVTTGFSLSTSVTFDFSTQFEIDAVVAKANVTFGFSFTLTAEYNKSVTKSITCEVPAGQRAFVYRGYLYNRLLKHNTAARTYEWVSQPGWLYTNIIRTSSVPLIGQTTIVTRRSDVATRQPVAHTS
ncbi:hypothetical protein D5S18_27215 [Nocardia panacis]|uniref:Uncharacterized protein n=1 Tax=Nocardia panacis TaxID=2340916 RepID=A0A3A4KMV3_9NOCA|nr:hypothetical protein [Nocardia panacis]RJO70876.1 hypothetical protein D5S18_27215 [Nocardia panacis]